MALRNPYPSFVFTYTVVSRLSCTTFGTIYYVHRITVAQSAPRAGIVRYVFRSNIVTCIFIEFLFKVHFFLQRMNVVLLLNCEASNEKAGLSQAQNVLRQLCDNGNRVTIFGEWNFSMRHYLYLNNT